MGSGSSLEHHLLSHVGRRRANNQDAGGVLEPWNREQYRRRGWLFVVADGMGAHAAGEMASALAVQEVTGTYEKLASRSPPLALEVSMRDANAKIHARGETSPDLKGMGTTCTTMAILPRGALVGHVGDSRAYRVRGGVIEQLTRDHSLAWEWEAKGGGADAALPAAVPKNVITRSMGPHPEVQLDLEGPFPVEPDDVFILCSDGLSGQVADEEIGALAATLPPKAAAAALIGLALVRGAPDNVTVVVARAGEKEQSRFSAKDPPWQLELPNADAGRPAIPWRTLLIAAASLLCGLVVNPWSPLVAVADPTLSPPRQDGILTWLLGKVGADAIGLVVGVAMAVTFIASLMTAVLVWLTAGGGGGGTLAPGQMIWQAVRRFRDCRGPYRSHDCRASPDLVEGIVASVESAADGLDAEAGGACLAPLPRARSAAAAGDFAGAFAAIAEALSAFTRAVGAADTG